MRDTCQNTVRDVWSQAEPYLMPAAIAAGVTFIVHQLWGATASLCFGAAVVGIGAAFPFLITELTQNDISLSVARLVLIGVLPFFGPVGILGSVALSAISSFTQDIRLFSIRSKLSDADRLAADIIKKREELIKARQTMIQECTEKNIAAENYWKSARPVESVYQSIDRYEQMTKDNQAFFANMLEQLKKQESHAAAADIIEDIKKFKVFIDAVTAKYEEVKRRALAAYVKIDTIPRNYGNI